MSEQQTLRAPAAPATSSKSERRTMLVACLMVFMAQMATTIYLPSLPAVEHDLGVSRGVATLSVSLFVIGAAAPVVLWGRAADRYGRRASVLAALALFVLSSALLAVNTSPAGLLVLRSVQGIGAGGAAIIARIFVRDLGSGDALARRLSVLSIAFVTALGGGQFLGGLIGRYAHWQAGFVLLAVVGTLGALGTTTLALDPGRGRGRDEQGGMVRIYLRILTVRAFLLPTVAGGLGFATIVLLQEVAPFVIQQHFGMSVEAYGNFGLLFGLAYFAGAMMVNRLAASAGSAWLMRTGALVMTASGLLMIVLWLVPGLQLKLALAVFVLLYCATTFGQAALFPSSMAVAVGGVKEHGAYAVALCGFLAQSIAGVVSTLAVLLHADLAWASVATALSALALLLVLRGNSRR
ncbi:DHA1 family bicyclomycin/chloramphenicol resistance-like MFS transporter [Kitasatospora sp. MAA4]|uniref:MFS transporter n=1 Tax=Kitasatospora sp. MAA4 TaxID=3035093 RepID=UPI002476599B|nr:MFS transporter [Kitasatospora sp. MAA4]MDH6132770.1 DHA1 family bicyclomycin/chloramphenicol resistance-like MFS transporter [Kitasatospora sp. MAA4]